MTEALTERQLAFRCLAVVLPQIRNRHDQLVVQRHLLLLQELQDGGSREQNLGQGCEVKPGATMQWRGFRFALRQTKYLDGTVPRCRDNPESSAGNGTGDGLGNGSCRGGKDLGGTQRRQLFLAALRCCVLYRPRQQEPIGHSGCRLVVWMLCQGIPMQNRVRAPIPAFCVLALTLQACAPVQPAAIEEAGAEPRPEEFIAQSGHSPPSPN